MKWKFIALGEVMRHRKGSITIDDTTSYKLCRVQLHRRGVVLRQNLIGAAISTKKQQVCKAGDFLVAEMDAKVGGYGFVPPELDGAIVSSHYYLFEVDAKKLHPTYIEVVSQAEIIQQQIVAKGSTNYSSIRPGSVLEWKIPLPEDLDVQKQIARNFRAIQSKLAEVGEEITHQQSLLAKLKRAILQEAIQGKLTADWRAAHPDVEPASQLLHRIQAEKARLIAAKKLRPEKPLPKITSSEIPFEIPKGWEWCRLIELSEKTGSGSTPSGGTSAYSTHGIPFVRSQNVHDDGLVLNDVARISTDIHHRMKGTTVYPEDLLLNITGGSIGRCAIVSDEIEEANINQHVAIIRPVIRTSGKFLHAVILSTYFQERIEEVQTGAGREGLPKNKMDRIATPLPPLAEQAAIVERVEALMTTCRALEAEIEHARSHAAHLLQAVLNEAFTSVT